MADVASARARLDDLVASGADRAAVERARDRLADRAGAARRASSRSVARDAVGHAARGAAGSLEGAHRSLARAMAAAASADQGGAGRRDDPGAAIEGLSADVARGVGDATTGALGSARRAVATLARDRSAIRRAARGALRPGDAARDVGRARRARGWAHAPALSAQRRVARRAWGGVGVTGASGVGVASRVARAARAVADAPLAAVRALLSLRALVALGASTIVAFLLLALALPMLVAPVVGMASTKGSSAGGGSGRLVQVAQQEYRQGADGGTYHHDDAKYWDYVMGGGFVGGSATPWCACFVSWCANEAGLVESGLFPKSASVQGYRSWFGDPSHGTIIPMGSYTPMAGDLVTYGEHHIGIVTRVDADGGFETIEGNTSGPAGGDQASGSHVNLKVHRRRGEHSWTLCWSSDMQFIRPRYPSAGPQGSITLPDGMGTFATREFDLGTDGRATGMASPYTFPAGTAQRRVQDAWVAAGAVHDDRGFCTLDGNYLVACTDTFGQVGDRIDFYLSDGTVLHCVKVDSKSMTYQPYDHHPANEWGHNGGQNVLEFCGEVRIGDNPYTTLGLSGVTVTSATDMGPAA